MKDKVLSIFNGKKTYEQRPGKKEGKGHRISISRASKGWSVRSIGKKKKSGPFVSRGGKWT